MKRALAAGAVLLATSALAGCFAINAAWDAVATPLPNDDKPWVAPGRQLTVHNRGERGAAYRDQYFRVVDNFRERHETLVDYVGRHFWRDMLWWGFVDSLTLYPSFPPLAEQIARWERRPQLGNRYCGSVPIDFHLVALRPDVYVAVENQWCISRRLTGAVNLESPLKSEQEVRELFLAHTHEREFSPHTATIMDRTPSLKRGSWRSAIRFTNSGVVEPYLRDGKQYSHIVPAPRLPQLWIARMDQPERPPQPIDAYSKPARVELGPGDVLHITLHDYPHKQVADKWIKAVRSES